MLPSEPKWFGLGISLPFNRHNTPNGELPRITISFRESFAPLTPAKFAAMRAGSLREPA